MKKITYLALLLILVSGACSNEAGHRSVHEFTGEVWNRFENPLLEFDITDPGIYYNIFMELKYKPSDDLKNFLATVIMNTPSGEIRSRDINFKFTGKEEGSDENILRIALRRDYAFSEQGICTFEVESRSPKVNIPGMVSLSIVMEKVQ